MTPPDSGEREVKRICGHLDTAWLCTKDPGHEGAHENEVFDMYEAPLAELVVLRRPLAQRILAALEGELTPDGYEESATLAAELRAIVERKP